MIVNIINNLQEIENVALSSKKERVAYLYQSDVAGLITPWSRQEDIETFQLKYIGGTIYISPGDIGIVIFAGDSYDILLSLFKKLCREINKKGYNAILNGNDILINGNRKIAASAMGHYCFINVNSTVEDIEKYIKINPQKVPDKLTNYGFNEKEIFDIVYNCLRGL